MQLSHGGVSTRLQPGTTLENRMTAASPLRDPHELSAELLAKAVYRSRALSRDGMLERVFALPFKGLVYPQIWEDPLVDMEAMRIEPHHHIVAIASGGCNVLSYLAADPARITAVDLSPAHVALVKLKIAGLRYLPDWDSFFRFFGKSDAQENIGAYHDILRPHLDPESRRYWDGRALNGKRRISRFKTNIYRSGLLGRFISAGHLMSRLHGRDLRGLLKCRTLEEQRAFFDREIAPLFDRGLVKWLTGFRASLFGLGIPPSQYEALAGGKPMASVLRERLEKLTCGFPLSENYFAWQAYGRAYAPDGSGPLPPYLQRQNFPLIRQRAARLKVENASLTNTLQNMEPGSVHRFVLLDAQDWMTDKQLNELWRAISWAAAPGARVIFRTAGKDTILPGRVEDAVLGRWQYHALTSRKLNKLDRSSIYGGFHVYELRA
jgi:S-adenosylmethionine-diacylglycerol 3-amino-3-carboxypropyl transferase